MPSYTDEQKRKALRLLDQLQSAQKVINQLGYPTETDTIRNWARKRSRYLPAESLSDIPVFQIGQKQKIQEAILDCFLKNMDVQSIAVRLHCSPYTVRKWGNYYKKQGYSITMSRNKKKDSSSALSLKELEALRAQMLDMQMEIDILKETINVLKKDPGVDPTALSNKEKAVIVDALKNNYSLPKLFKKLQLSRSSYYYTELSHSAKTTQASLIKRIQEIFQENDARYGYRRIHSILRREGIIVSEKIVRRIMKEKDLKIKPKRKRKFNSYKGEISPEVPNHVERNFHADRPNQKWLTDITEFSIPAGKLYLSPIIDCYDGLPVSWKIGTSPNARLVNTMLEEAIAMLKEGEKPIIHSDRGCHYRWPGWIERTEKAGLTRSMSKKGCSPDNSACEGFFGILKNEMFYGRDWKQATLSELREAIEKYIHWFRKDRIKMSLGGMSPLDYRRRNGYAI